MAGAEALSIVAGLGGFVSPRSFDVDFDTQRLLQCCQRRGWNGLWEQDMRLVIWCDDDL